MNRGYYMLIKDIFKKKKPVISFEIFPPKKEYSIDTIFNTIYELKDLNPDFISVTYGSGGGSRDRTVEIASLIKNKYNIECLAHLACISSTDNETTEILNQLKINGVNNVLALRGDLPIDFQRTDTMTYKYAQHLVSKIVSIGGFSIGAAANPEGHVDSLNLKEDIKYLKQKVDSGVDFLITQLFFDNEALYRFMENCSKIGISVPISAGIMPVLNKNQIKRMVELSGASLPQKFIRIMDKYENNTEALREAGIAYATEQIIDLLSWGIDGIHIYTMNKADVTKRIVNNITEIRMALK
jgi:methylenetetrahydrofolate reductase (NADPH)